ncbi:hypothetical protein GCM10009086_20930 [Pseudomonas rhodesiae]
MGSETYCAESVTGVAVRDAPMIDGSVRICSRDPGFVRRRPELGGVVILLEFRLCNKLLARARVMGI